MAKVLVVDDDPDTGMWANWVLERQGHEVQVKSSARGVTAPALGLPSDPVFDVAIIDLNMPEVDGIEAIRALKGTSPSTKIVAISGGGLLSSANLYLHWARLSGADHVLAKPFTCEELCKAIERALSWG